jgi:enamine deaminase RidA (YjgF/YER057c/UK114 family)
LDDVVKSLFFITDVSKYAEVSAVRNEYFEVARPASAVVEISNTVVEGCGVEIEVMAMIDNQ